MSQSRISKNLRSIPKNTQSTVLVAGGAGFIGSNLCSRLIKEGCRVLCLDNLSTGQQRNIRALERSDLPFQFIHHDILKPIDFVDIKIDYIVFAASPASPPQYKKIPLETARSNTEGLWNLLMLAKKHKARFIYTSTSEIYGDPPESEHPQRETYHGNVNTQGERSCYDESKRYGETLVYLARKIHKVDAVTVRIFNTYGPNMHPQDGRVVSNFIMRALKGLPLEIYGNGEQTRSFCYVDDMVEALVRCMFHLTSTYNGEAINLGNPDEHTIKDLAEQIKILTGSSSPILYKPRTEDDPTRRKPVIERAKTFLNWEPRVSLVEGLATTIDYFHSLASIRKTKTTHATLYRYKYKISDVKLYNLQNTVFYSRQKQLVAVEKCTSKKPGLKSQ